MYISPLLWDPAINLSKTTTTKNTHIAAESSVFANPAISHQREIAPCCEC